APCPSPNSQRGRQSLRCKRTPTQGCCTDFPNQLPPGLSSLLSDAAEATKQLPIESTQSYSACCGPSVGAAASSLLPSSPAMANTTAAAAAGEASSKACHSAC
ncbi:hypothetical protein Vafri_12867, partial [Volvox africanus]